MLPFLSLLLRMQSIVSVTDSSIFQLRIPFFCCSSIWYLHGTQILFLSAWNKYRSHIDDTEDIKVDNYALQETLFLIFQQELQQRDQRNRQQWPPLQTTEEFERYFLEYWSTLSWNATMWQWLLYPEEWNAYAQVKNGISSPLLSKKLQQRVFYNPTHIEKLPSWKVCYLVKGSFIIYNMGPVHNGCFLSSAACEVEGMDKYSSVLSSDFTTGKVTAASLSQRFDIIFRKLNDMIKEKQKVERKTINSGW